MNYGGNPACPFRSEPRFARRSHVIRASGVIGPAVAASGLTVLEVVAGSAPDHSGVALGGPSAAAQVAAEAGLAARPAVADSAADRCAFDMNATLGQFIGSSGSIPLRHCLSATAIEVCSSRPPSHSALLKSPSIRKALRSTKMVCPEWVEPLGRRQFSRWISDPDN